MVDGVIARTGDRRVADELEREGYSSFEAEGRGA
jgi:hypothetical protein